jgi:hypothetical protein
MRAFAALALVAGLAGCAGYHQQVAALRAPRPADPPGELAAYAAPGPNDPSVTGDILAGTAPASGAAFEATAGENPPPAPPVEPQPR